MELYNKTSLKRKPTPVITSVHPVFASHPPFIHIDGSWENVFPTVCACVSHSPPQLRPHRSCSPLTSTRTSSRSLSTAVNLIFCKAWEGGKVSCPPGQQQRGYTHIPVSCPRQRPSRETLWKDFKSPLLPQRCNMFCNPTPLYYTFSGDMPLSKR